MQNPQKTSKNRKQIKQKLQWHKVHDLNSGSGFAQLEAESVLVEWLRTTQI